MRQLTISKRLTNRETASFNLYLKDINEISVLTPADETILAERASHGDLQAKDELIRRNLRFVVSVAKQYSTATIPVEDLVNEGNIGLILASEKFKPEMGFRFISYSVWWIRKIILEHISNYGKTVRLPLNKINQISKLDKKINYLEQKLGRAVDIQEVISEFGEEAITEDFEDLFVLSTYSVDSLDREIGGEDGNHTTLADIMSVDSAYDKSDNLLINQDLKNEVTRVLSTLKPRDKRIIEALYGLDGQPPMTLQEVGNEIGITREMIRQIKVKIFSKLRTQLGTDSTMQTY